METERQGFLHRDIHFCTKCRYNFKKTFFGKKKENVIHGVYKIFDEKGNESISLVYNEDVINVFIKWGLTYERLEWEKYETD